VCGIAGIVSDGAPVRREDVARMAERQAHRGPDGEGLWMSPDGRAGLSHRRLAILDLSPAGAQPCSDDENDVHLVYNGEIYNFRELRAELEQTGWRFRSRGDAEVVLRGYQQWGDAVVERLRGMFALGIWDGPRRRLFLARDRLGIKPLHWAEANGLFAFASELKGVEAGPIAGRSVDVSALWDFLTYLYVPAPKTPWRGVRKLPPAHVLVREAGRTAIRRYWSPDFSAGGSSDERRLAEELCARLEEAVRLHLVSDVPVGALLSGGIDSSAVTALAARAGAGLRTYTVGFDEASVSEAPFARRVAERFGTDHVEETSRLEAARAAFDGLADWLDEPFADTSIVPTALVCEAARRGVKVALSGDGGDELFAGYRRYAKSVRQRGRDVLPHAVRRRLGPLLARRLPPASPGRRSLLRWGMDDPARHVLLHGGMTRPEKEDALPAAVVARFAGYDDCWAIRRHWREDLDPWSRQQYADLMTYLPDDLLTKVDRASMRVGLEVRPPLLDHRFVEWAAGVPARIRVRGGLKSLFKSALAEILPPEILDRKKQGFSIPTERWTREGLFRDMPPRGWYLPHRVAWSLLARWTGPKIGVGDPSEILREGP
jgi:asparagine synthase (glutamine-hydrolysing)